MSDDYTIPKSSTDLKNEFIGVRKVYGAPKPSSSPTSFNTVRGRSVYGTVCSSVNNYNFTPSAKPGPAELGNNPYSLSFHHNFYRPTSETIHSSMTFGDEDDTISPTFVNNQKFKRKWALTKLFDGKGNVDASVPLELYNEFMNS